MPPSCSHQSFLPCFVSSCCAAVQLLFGEHFKEWREPDILLQPHWLLAMTLSYTLKNVRRERWFVELSRPFVIIQVGVETHSFFSLLSYALDRCNFARLDFDSVGSFLFHYVLFSGFIIDHLRKKKGVDVGMRTWYLLCCNDEKKAVRVNTVEHNEAIHTRLSSITIEAHSASCLLRLFCPPQMNASISNHFRAAHRINWNLSVPSSGCV